MKWMLNGSPFLPGTGSITENHKSVVEDKATDERTGNWTCVLNARREWRASTTLSVQGETLSWRQRGVVGGLYLEISTFLSLQESSSQARAIESFMLRWALQLLSPVCSLLD